MATVAQVPTFELLPTEQREVVELIREEKTATEVAQILGIDPSEVLRLLQLALENLGLLENDAPH